MIFDSAVNIHDQRGDRPQRMKKVICRHVGFGPESRLYELPYSDIRRNDGLMYFHCKNKLNP